MAESNENVIQNHDEAGSSKDENEENPFVSEKNKTGNSSTDSVRRSKNRISSMLLNVNDIRDSLTSVTCDPLATRRNDHPTTDFETLIHLIKSSMSSGLLNTPQTFSRAGLFPGVIGTILIGIIVSFCLDRIIKTKFKLGYQHRLALMRYSICLKYALLDGPPCLKPLSKVLPVIADTLILLYETLMCSVYLTFIGKAVKDVVGAKWEMKLSLWICMITPPLIFMNCVMNLKRLAPWSALANVMIFLGLILMMYVLMVEDIPREPLKLMSNNLLDIPLFMTTMITYFAGVTVITLLANHMVTPKSLRGYLGVIIRGMCFIVILYMGIGLLGYYHCRSKCLESITVDLSGNQDIIIAIKILFAIAIFFSYALQIFVPVRILWQILLMPKLKKISTMHFLILEYSLRTVIVIVTLVIALVLPNLDEFMFYVAAVCLTLLSIVFPNVMNVCMNYPDHYGFQYWRLYRAVFLIVFSILTVTASFIYVIGLRSHIYILRDEDLYYNTTVS